MAFSCRGSRDGHRPSSHSSCVASLPRAQSKERSRTFSASSGQRCATWFSVRLGRVARPSPSSHTANACRGLVREVSGGEQGLAADAEVGFVGATLCASLAVVKPPSSDDVQSKSPAGPGKEEMLQLMKPRKTSKHFESSQISTLSVADGLASPKTRDDIFSWRNENLSPCGRGLIDHPS